MLLIFSKHLKVKWHLLYIYSLKPYNWKLNQDVRFQFSFQVLWISPVPDFGQATLYPMILLNLWEVPSGFASFPRLNIKFKLCLEIYKIPLRTCVCVSLSLSLSLSGRVWISCKQSCWLNVWRSYRRDIYKSSLGENLPPTKPMSRLEGLVLSLQYPAIWI